MAKVKTAEELMAEAEELQKQLAPELYGDKGDGGTSDKNDETSGDTPTPGDEKDKTPEETDEDKAARLAAEEEEKKKAAAEAGTPDPKDEEIVRLKDELARVKATAGRVTQTAEANDRLRERIAVLENEIAGIKETKKKEPEVPAADDELTEIIDEYGENSLEVRRYKRQRDMIDSLKGELDSIKGELKTVKDIPARTAADTYITSLTGQVPDWKTIRDTEEFGAFLDEKAGKFGSRTILDELKDADAKKDATATAAIYQAFKEKSGTPPSKKTDDTPPTKKGKERLLAPGSSGKAEDVDTTEYYTVAEVESMTKEMQSLRTKGQNKKADAIKAKLDAFTDKLGSFK